MDGCSGACIIIMGGPGETGGPGIVYPGQGPGGGGNGCMGPLPNPFLVGLVPAGLSPVDSVNWHFLCAFLEASWFCSGIFVGTSSVDLSGLPIPAVVHSTAGHTGLDVELQACGRSFDPLRSASGLCKRGNGLQTVSAIACIPDTSKASSPTSRSQSW